MDKSTFKIGMFARQTGKTFTTTLEIVLDCLEKEAIGQRAKWVILSRGERQAKEAMEEGVKLHCRAINVALKDTSLLSRDTFLEVEFPGGSRIKALPANPDTARGFSSNVFLDEFAFHQDSRKIWAALFPVISAGHKIRITSTPNGKDNKFYELMTDPELDALWSRHTVDIYQAVQQGLQRDIPMLRKGLNDADAWAQEYEIQWLDEASSWLSFDLIADAENLEAGVPSYYEGGDCYVGVDIAARNDLFVIWVLEAVGDILWTREIIAGRRIGFAEQNTLLDGVFRRYRVIKCLIDQTGMGEPQLESAKRRHGSRVEGVLFTVQTKLALATVGKQAFEDRKIRIPTDDMDVRNDLHQIKKEVSATGVARFVAERNSNGHADRAWACFLACYAASGEQGMPAVASRHRRESFSILKGY